MAIPFRSLNFPAWVYCATCISKMREITFRINFMVEFINMQYHEMYLNDKVTAAASICRDKLNADPSTSGDTQCWLAALLRLIF